MPSKGTERTPALLTRPETTTPIVRRWPSSRSGGGPVGVISREAKMSSSRPDLFSRYRLRTLWLRPRCSLCIRHGVHRLSNLGPCFASIGSFSSPGNDTHRRLPKSDLRRWPSSTERHGGARGSYTMYLRFAARNCIKSEDWTIFPDRTSYWRGIKMKKRTVQLGRRHPITLPPRPPTASRWSLRERFASGPLSRLKTLMDPTDVPLSGSG